MASLIGRVRLTSMASGFLIGLGQFLDQLGFHGAFRLLGALFEPGVKGVGHLQRQLVAGHRLRGYPGR
jgi:hypothetical protein